MAETAYDEYVTEAGPSEEHGEAGDSGSNVEWRSYDQVENGTPSTSPFWDTDSEEDGPKPSELFGKHTWKIDNFSKVNKRELRSDPFDAGGYKWYILIYPQGCDVCNHISLFLCVANHDKLLPGWSHFAQFTIAVVNKDPKKSKYSDTLHRFWKKEHDWGWKKFMELSKVQDGFLVDGVLVIKAQVQVIREKLDRPFRCLDRIYRRELVRIYMTNIENICRRFVDERRSRLVKLIDDKSKWSSFHAFWRGISASARHCMSRERSDVILKIIVKHFFIEKEVTSTLIMDSLYSGLRALELQSMKNKKWRELRLAELEEMPPPMVWVDQDMFVLADDVMPLLERAVLESVPCQATSTGKDDKVSQNRTTKDGTPPMEEITKDTIERDERRLTEFGRKILELFVLSHIVSGIEVSYQEAIALKRQEELIREEEAWMNETETKGRREKEKKTKKKQAKQKKNKKSKEKEKDEKLDLTNQEEIPEDNSAEDGIVNEVASEGVSETGEADMNGEDAANGDDASVEEVTAYLEAIDFVEQEMVNDEEVGMNSTSADDDWVPVVASNKGSSLSSNKIQTSPIRGKNQRSKSTNEKMGLASAMSYPNERTSSPVSNVTNERVGPVPMVSGKSSEPFSSINSKGQNTQPDPSAALSLKDRIQKLEQRLPEEQPIFLQKKTEHKDPSPSPAQSQAHTRPQTLNKSAITISAPTLSPSDPSDKPQVTAKPYIPLRISAPAAASSSATLGAGRAALPVVTLSSQLVPNSAAFHAATNYPAPSSVPGTFVVSNSVSLPVASTHAAPATTPALSMTNKHTVTIRPPLSPKPESSLRITPEPVNHAQTKNLATASQASPVSRPLSAPGVPLPAMRPAAPTGTPVQVSPYLSRSVSLSGRVGNPSDMASSPSAPGFFPQSYRNAITGDNNTLPGSGPNFNLVGFTPQSSQSFTQGATSTNSSIIAQSSSSFGHQSASFGQIGLDASTSGMSQSNSSFFSSSKSFKPISWKHGMDESIDDESLGQAGPSGLYQPAGPSWSYQQADASRLYPPLVPNGSEDPREPLNWRAKIADEFPHMDIINDLLEEPTRLPKFTFPSWWMPIPGVRPQPNTGSTSGSSLFDLPEHPGLTRPAYGSNVREGHTFQFSNAPFNNAPYYVNGQNDGMSQKRWAYDYTTDLSMNMGLNMNGFSHGSGDYSYLPGGANRFRYPHDSGH
ncbi:hypothetical protein LUZ61_002533 [Rhynchospora tenuis]|uniref:MATH domain-containing protein n=1 Tax=Rhynchospora tenuis TaxID=198213 RepID=A0AAD5ZJ98_9POAL|nr:hypothetical protein LUZ61_002533 [Rhynchospora tenuis]